MGKWANAADKQQWLEIPNLENYANYVWNLVKVTQSTRVQTIWRAAKLLRTQSQTEREIN